VNFIGLAWSQARPYKGHACMTHSLTIFPRPVEYSPKVLVPTSADTDAVNNADTDAVNNADTDAVNNADTDAVDDADTDADNDSRIDFVLLLFLVKGF
jgi:hypothetical protein